MISYNEIVKKLKKIWLLHFINISIYTLIRKFYNVIKTFLNLIIMKK